MEIEFFDNKSLSKNEYLNFKYFVLSSSFKGRTGNSDQALLVALINQHIKYTNGKSGVRPGIRKMRTETALSATTVNSALWRLHSQGWIEQMNSGNREGTASIWRVKFQNPPFLFDGTVNYKELVNPLAENELIWTKYCLGNRALTVLNVLHQEFQKSDSGLICTRIMESTECSRPPIMNALAALINVNLVNKVGKKYTINPEIYLKPEVYVTEILDYYSAENQKQKMKELHLFEKRLTVEYRAQARQANIQNIISARTAKKNIA